MEEEIIDPIVAETRLFAVFRDGKRVSESEYESAAFAAAELKYWQAIVNRHPDGSRVEVKPIGNSLRAE